MTTPPSLPALPGLTWSRHKKPSFSTRVASHSSGREVRVALMSYPLYEFEAVYSGLTSSTSAFAGLGASSLQSLMGFFLQLQGQFGTFLYTDPDDNAATNQTIGLGDGTTQTFLISRTLGGWNEPVSWVTGVSAVYVNGVVQPASNWLFTAPNSIGLGSAPAAGATISATFTYAFQCRFLDDDMEFEEFMSTLWKLESMKFRSVKVNGVPSSNIPTWYSAYAIGSTNPLLFADWTTEGTTNHYLYNGSTYGSFAALLTAVGGTFSRSSSKYITNSSGLLASIASSALPFDYSPTSIGTLAGLLLEGASTNYFNPSNTASAYDNAYGTTTTQSGVGPDGVSNSAIFVQNGSGTNYFTPYRGVSGLTAGTNTFSIYAKAGSANWLMFGPTTSATLGAYFNLSNGTIGNVGSATVASITPAPNGFYRCSITLTTGTSSYVSPTFVSLNGEGNYGIATFVSAAENGYVFGAQVEAGPTASSYIPTTTSAASRTADSLYVPWTSMTFAARVKATLAGQVNGNYLADTGNGLLTEAAGLDVETSNGSQALTTSISAVTQPYIIVVGGSSSGRVLSINGNAAVSDNYALVPSAPSVFYVGQNASGAGQANGDYAQVSLWNIAPTAAQAASNSGAQ